MATTMTLHSPHVYREWSLMHPQWTRKVGRYARIVKPKRIVPSHFNKNGRPKRGYASEAVARAEADRLGMTYYRCDFCDRFHLASKS